MQPFGPGAFCEILDDTAGHATRDAECVDDLPRVEPDCCADASRGSHRPEDRGRGKAGRVDGLWHDKTQTAENLGASRDADLRRSPIWITTLAGGENCRHDHRAGMHGPTFESVVEIFSMCGGAVHERRARGAQRTFVADDGA